MSISIYILKISSKKLRAITTRLERVGMMVCSSKRELVFVSLCLMSIYSLFSLPVPAQSQQVSSSDLDLIGQRFGNSMERYESVKYGVPAPVESTEGLLPFADRIDDMMDKEYAYVGDNNDLYMTSIEYDLEVGKMLSEESNSRRYELTYNVTRRSEEDQGNPPWEEEETFEVELDHVGRVVNIVNKDLDYLHDHEYV